MNDAEPGLGVDAGREQPSLDPEDDPAVPSLVEHDDAPLPPRLLGRALKGLRIRGVFG